jgi:hypothetical protein
VALALVFNRRSLDPKTLWPRIDTAVQSGLTAANGADVGAFVNAACEHLLASPNAVVSPEFSELMAPIFSLDEDAAYAFLRHLAASRYTFISFGKEEWEARKELKKAASRIDSESEVSE